MAEVSWNRYSVMVARAGEVPRVWRAKDETAAWVLSLANRKARELRRRYDTVDVVPARDEDVAKWQKTEIANRTSLHNRFAIAAE